MPSVSKKQQKFFGIVRSIQKGDADASEFSKDARDAAKKMKKGDVKKFAKTKHKGLPTKVRQEIDQIVDSVIEEYTMARKNVIDKIATLAKANRYGSVDGTQMNGKTAKEIMAIYNHPKMKKFKKAMTDYTADDFVNLTIKLPKVLGIKVESVNEENLQTLLQIAKQMRESDESVNEIKIWDLNEKCWKGYEKKGMKTMFGKRYPNCVKKKKSESVNETPYELGGMKVYSKADGLKKVKSMQKTDGAKIYKVTKTKTKLYGKHPVTMYNLYTKNKNHSTRQNPYGLDMMKGVYLIPVKESVNEEIEMSKGVKKLMKIADTGFAKVGGVTVDGMSANLFKQIYNKANDDIKQKLNTKNEKQLVRILGGMWQKFGKNVTIGSSL